MAAPQDIEIAIRWSSSPYRLALSIIVHLAERRLGLTGTREEGKLWIISRWLPSATKTCPIFRFAGFYCIQFADKYFRPYLVGSNISIYNIDGKRLMKCYKNVNKVIKSNK